MNARTVVRYGALVLVAAPFAYGYYHLLWHGRDSIAAARPLYYLVELLLISRSNIIGGTPRPEVGFIVISAILGWISVAASERVAGFTGPEILLFAWPVCALAIIMGFAIGAIAVWQFSWQMGQMLVCSVIPAILVSMIRASLDQW